MIFWGMKRGCSTTEKNSWEPFELRNEFEKRTNQLRLCLVTVITFVWWCFSWRTKLMISSRIHIPCYSWPRQTWEPNDNCNLRSNFALTILSSSSEELVRHLETDLIKHLTKREKYTLQRCPHMCLCTFQTSFSWRKQRRGQPQG
jgi:hypothetical protein